MFDPQQYQLLDFGDGRRLERFHQYALDRPCPAAEKVRRRHKAWWKQADARFERQPPDRGIWNWPRPLPPTWTVSHQDVTFELRFTEQGQVGLFSEQAENWDWITRHVSRAPSPPRVLNLFAYTGGSTLAAAAAGARVVHVDAARSVVAWARRCAALSGIRDAPIRWIVDDATRFVQRELRRAGRYDGVILDPPSYGHGPKGEVWQLRKSLLEMLRACRELADSPRAFVLLTCHSPGYGPAELSACLADGWFGQCGGDVVAHNLYLRTADGRRLPSGVVARWPP